MLFGSFFPSPLPSRPAHFQVEGMNCMGPTARSDRVAVVGTTVGVGDLREPVAVQDRAEDRAERRAVLVDVAAAGLARLDLADRGEQLPRHVAAGLARRQLGGRLLVRVQDRGRDAGLGVARVRAGAAGGGGRVVGGAVQRRQIGEVVGSGRRVGRVVGAVRRGGVAVVRLRVVTPGAWEAERAATAAAATAAVMTPPAQPLAEYRRHAANPPVDTVVVRSPSARTQPTLRQLPPRRYLFVPGISRLAAYAFPYPLSTLVAFVQRGASCRSPSVMPRRCCRSSGGTVRRGRLVPSLLVAGSSAPDVTYFAASAVPGAMEFGAFTHPSAGVFTVDVLLACALVALWRLVREPVLALLPRRV